MSRGLDAPLSALEESALYRVGAGFSKPDVLPPREIVRLVQLGLVEERDATFRLTDLGQERLRRLDPPPDRRHPSSRP